jgi:hypothetical protein
MWEAVEHHNMIIKFSGLSILLIGINIILCCNAT